MIHFAPHWNLAVETGKIIPLLCFTNCEYVELFLNGKSFGKKSYAYPGYGMTEIYGHYDAPQRKANTDDLFLAWDVPYEPGIVEAIGYNQGKEVIRESMVTAGEPSVIQAICTTKEFRANARDIAQIEIALLDDKSHLNEQADSELFFELSGPGKLLGLDNGLPSSKESFQGTNMHAFGGRLLAIVQSTKIPGDITLRISGKGLKTAEIQIKAK
jgi:beta-galactosidase